MCLCDAFSRPQYPPAVRQSPRSSPSKVAGLGAGDEVTPGDDEADVEPSDVDVCFLISTEDSVSSRLFESLLISYMYEGRSVNSGRLK